MTIPSVADDETIATAWGNAVADDVNDHEDRIDALEALTAGARLTALEGDVAGLTADIVTLGAADGALDARIDALEGAAPTTGTFTPGLAFATPGTSSFTGATASGTWTRLGNRVWFNATIQCTLTKGTAAGTLSLTGLPFTVATQIRLPIFWTPYTKAGYTAGFANLAAGGTTAALTFTGSGVAAATLVPADLADGTIIVNVSGSYLTS